MVEIRETNRTRRVKWIVLGAVACVLAIVYAVIRLAEQPPWLTLSLAIVVIVPQVLVVKVVIGVHRSYVRRRNERVRELEKMVDPERTTSGLKPDGASRDDI